MFLKYCAIIILVAICTIPHIESKGGRSGRSRRGFVNRFSSRKSSSVVTIKPYTSNNFRSRRYSSNNYRSSHTNNRRTFAVETATKSSSSARSWRFRDDKYVSISGLSDLHHLSLGELYNKMHSASGTATKSSNRVSGSHSASNNYASNSRSNDFFDLTLDELYNKIDLASEIATKSSNRVSTSRSASDTYASNSRSSGLYDLSLDELYDKIHRASEITTKLSYRVSGSHSASVVKTTPRNYLHSKPETSTRRSTQYHTYQNRSYKEGNDIKYNETYETSRVYNSYYGGDVNTKSAILAGLRDSALELHLGHQLSNINKNYHSHYPDDSQPSYPQYSFVHHYHRGDIPITRDAVINAIVKCTNITFCTPNTQPLCLVNETIYCLTPIDEATKCNENSTNLICVNTTLTIPCLNSTDTHCDNTTHVRNETVQIPCVTNLYVFGDFSNGTLKARQIKNNSRIGTNSTQNNNSTVNTELYVNSTSPLDTNITVSVAITTQSPPTSEDPNIGYKGTINEFCVTVIAQPVFGPKNLTNAQFAKYVRADGEAREQVRAKFEKMLGMLLA